MIRTSLPPPLVTARHVPRFPNVLPCESGIYTVITRGCGPMLLRVGRVYFQESSKSAEDARPQREAKRTVDALHADRRRS